MRGSYLISYPKVRRAGAGKVSSVFIDAFLAPDTGGANRYCFAWTDIFPVPCSMNAFPDFKKSE
jgi:hypothetical protein